MPNATDSTADRRLLRAATRRQHVMKYAVIVGVVLAAIGGIGQLWSLGTAAVAMVARPSDQAIGAASADDTARVGDFAMDWIQTYLTTARGHESDLATFYTGDVALPETPVDAIDPQLASLPEPQPGPAPNLQQWSVVVSVAQRDSADSLQRRRVYYQATIVVLDRTRLRATTLPAVVSPVWDTGVDVSLDYETVVSDSDPAVVAITGFLRALLAGGNDMSRYVAAGYDARPMTPPPFRSIAITNVRSQSPTSSATGATQVRMIASIKGTRAFSTVPMQYPLRLIVTDGRWEVAGIELFPALGSKASDPPPPADGAAPSTAPNPSGTPTDSVFGKP
ncbi:putative membrane protein [Mycolicibacterium mageritense DSM 44476 = CIP 104973]|uniref:conjugal transfer protein n=1 Tax=Mycolicibacterium mageritense TaxID=53462 RepID=UPI001E4CA8B2|nr:conjugal transfer protein [Mycolicibacterium mageritense]MCC9185564.1 conjugal transfer protein [Mycolicibacterium mageritense]